MSVQASSLAGCAQVFCPVPGVRLSTGCEILAGRVGAFMDRGTMRLLFTEVFSLIGTTRYLGTAENRPSAIGVATVNRRDRRCRIEAKSCCGIRLSRQSQVCGSGPLTLARAAFKTCAIKACAATMEKVRRAWVRTRSCQRFRQLVFTPASPCVCSRVRNLRRFDLHPLGAAMRHVATASIALIPARFQAIGIVRPRNMSLARASSRCLYLWLHRRQCLCGYSQVWMENVVAPGRSTSGRTVTALASGSSA